MTRLAILGASGHGKVVADAAECAGHWKEIMFFDDKWPDVKRVESWSVEGDFQALSSSLGEIDGVIVAIGNNVIRYDKYKQLLSMDAPLVSIIHPNAIVSRSASIGAGSVVFAGAVINPYVQTGIGCIVNIGATVDHDCILGDAVHVSPGVNLAGGVTVGEKSWVGIGAAVRQNIAIGECSIVGAGAVVLNTVPDSVTVGGVPARVLKNG